MARIEASIEDFSTRVATLPRSFWRRHGDTSLATLPGGIRLAVLTSPFIVRWAAWLVAVLIVFVADVPEVNRRFEPWLLIGTMIADGRRDVLRAGDPAAAAARPAPLHRARRRTTTCWRSASST